MSNLRLINETSGTNVSSVSLTDVFSADFDIYKIEQTDYTPILFEDVIKRIEAEGGTVGFKNGNGPAM